MKQKTIIITFVLILTIVVIMFVCPYVTVLQQKPDPNYIKYFKMNKSDIEHVKSALQSVDQIDEQLGYSLFLKQTITYGNVICLLVDIEFPNGSEEAESPQTVIPNEYNLKGEGMKDDWSKGCETIEKSNETRTLTCVFWFINKSSTFSNNQMVSFSLSSFNISGDDSTYFATELQNPLSVSWKTHSVVAAKEVTIDGEKICGIAMLTPISLYVRLDKSPYKSLEDLVKDIQIVDIEGTHLEEEMFYLGDCTAMKNTNLSICFSSLISPDAAQAIRMCEELFYFAQ